jgi:hypothetical protein
MTHRVRRDLNEQEADQLAQDEVAAVAPLRGADGLERLLKLELGPLTADAHVLGLLAALERMQLARGLPRHLKVFALEGPSRVVFGVASPNISADPTQKLQPGVWLNLLLETAKAGGYPVPENLRPAERNMLAWNGILKAFADRLRQEETHLSQHATVTLRRVLHAVIQRLDEDYSIANQAAKLTAQTAPTGAPPPSPSHS